MQNPPERGGPTFNSYIRYHIGVGFASEITEHYGLPGVIVCQSSVNSSDYGIWIIAAKRFRDACQKYE